MLFSINGARKGGAGRGKSPSALGKGGSGVVPPALIEEERVPKFYTEHIELCGAVNPSCDPDTTLVRRMMLASQLPEETLADIWSLCNRTKTGGLVRSEFYSCLALIALAQRGQPLSALCEASTLPIPHLQTFVINSTHSGDKTSSPQSKTQSSNHIVVDSQRKTNDTSILGRLTKYRRRGVATATADGGQHASPAPNVLIDLTPTDADTSVTNEDATTNSILDVCADIDFRRSTAEHDTSADEALVDGVSQQANVSIWESCLREARSMLREHYKLASNYRRPIMTEVLETTQNGRMYIASMASISAVIQRIGRSIAELVETCTIEEVASLRESCDSVIGELTRLCEQCQCEGKEASSSPARSSSEQPRCPICYQHAGHSRQANLPSTTQFLGHTYHTHCANFYLNRVGVVLPQL